MIFNKIDHNQSKKTSNRKLPKVHSFHQLPKYPKNLPNNKLHHKNILIYLQNPKKSSHTQIKKLHCYKKQWSFRTKNLHYHQIEDIQFRTLSKQFQ